jgi:hypothetical protein
LPDDHEQWRNAPMCWKAANIGRKHERASWHKGKSQPGDILH